MKRNIMRKMLVLLLGNIIVLGLCACGENNKIIGSSEEMSNGALSDIAPQESKSNDESIESTDEMLSEVSSIDSQESDLLSGIPMLTDAKPGIYQTISSNGLSCFVVKNDNTLWAWGYNHNGQLGIGTKTELNGPQQMEPVLVMEDVKAVSTGGSGGNDHTLILKTDGTLWSCGSNAVGQLGNGMSGDGIHSTPIYIMEDVVSVCAGDSSFAIKSDNSLWAWGWNYFGELGTGSTESQPSPVKVMDNVVSVSNYGSDTFAIKTDGSLWAWGLNHTGTLGNGTTESTTVPVKIMDNVKAVSSQSATCAIKTDDTLWVWGAYWRDDQKNGKLICEPMYLTDDVAAAWSGSDYTWVLKNDGTLWRWNTYFQIFYFTNDGKWKLWDDTGKPVNQLTDIVAMDGALIVKSDGTLFKMSEDFPSMDNIKIP